MFKMAVMNQRKQMNTNKFTFLSKDIENIENYGQ